MHTLDLLNASRDGLIRELHSIPEEKMNTKPDAVTWSPKELCEHLWKMEHYVLENLTQEKIQDKGAVYKPVRLTIVRQIKVEAPSMLQPEQSDMSKDEIFNHLFEARNQLIDQYLHYSRNHQLKYSAKHPVFQRLKLKQWYDYVAYHEKRHTDQLQRIKQALDL